MVDEREEEAADFEERELCPDGSCVGVIGDDGRCRVCGRKADGSAAAIERTETVSDEEAGEESGEFEARELCPDGNCVGVIGDDGRCRVCGRERE